MAKEKDAMVVRFRTHAEFWEWLGHYGRLWQLEQGRELVQPLVPGLDIAIDPQTGRAVFQPSDGGEGKGDPGGGGGGDGHDRGPFVDTDPANRERMRTSAAEARQQLAQDAAQAPAEAPAKKPRGRRKAAPDAAQPPAEAKAEAPMPPVTTEDQSGDGELGETKPDEVAEDHHDYDALDPPKASPGTASGANGAAKKHTPAETRAALIDLLRQVHDVNRVEVESLAASLGVKKLSQVPDDNVAALWTGTENLCAKYGVAFPPAGMAPP